MSVVGHVGRDEHPLRELVCREVVVKHGEVLALGEAVGVRGHRVVRHQRVVLAHVVVGAGRVLPVGFESAVGRVLLVDAPGDGGGLEAVDDGGHRGRDAAEAVVGDGEGGRANRRDVVGLRGVRDGEVVGVADTEAGEVGEVRWGMLVRLRVDLG